MSMLNPADYAERGDDATQRLQGVIWLIRPTRGSGFNPVRDVIFASILLLLLLTSAFFPSSPLSPLPALSWGFVPYMIARTATLVVFMSFVEPSPGLQSILKSAIPSRILLGFYSRFFVSFAPSPETNEVMKNSACQHTVRQVCICRPRGNPRAMGD